MHSGTIDEQVKKELFFEYMVKYEEFKLSSPTLQPDSSGARLVLPPPRPDLARVTGAKETVGLPSNVENCVVIQSQPRPRPPLPVAMLMRPKLVIPYVLPVARGASSAASSAASSSAPNVNGEAEMAATHQKFANPYAIPVGSDSSSPHATPRPSMSANLEKKLKRMNDAVVEEPGHDTGEQAEEFEYIMEETEDVPVMPRSARRRRVKKQKKRKMKQKPSRKWRKPLGSAKPRRWRNWGKWRKWRNWRKWQT